MSGHCVMPALSQITCPVHLFLVPKDVSVKKRAMTENFSMSSEDGFITEDFLCV